jgi:hypothetical protein
MKGMKPDPGNTYQIKIKEKVDTGLIAWLGGLTISSVEDNGTLLAGVFPNQAALRGFLDRLWNLNLTVLSVERTRNEENP